MCIKHDLHSMLLCQVHAAEHKTACTCLRAQDSVHVSTLDDDDGDEGIATREFTWVFETMSEITKAWKKEVQVRSCLVLQ